LQSAKKGYPVGTGKCNKVYSFCAVIAHLTGMEKNKKAADRTIFNLPYTLPRNVPWLMHNEPLKETLRQWGRVSYDMLF